MRGSAKMSVFYFLDGLLMFSNFFKRYGLTLSSLLPGIKEVQK